MPNPPDSPPSPAQDRIRITHGLARLVLVAFLFTFITARLLVIAIMSDHLPHQLFFHVNGTHVHHLNYGIFLLSITGGFLIFYRPAGKLLSITAAVYGVGLALTFDEFGMWLHLGGLYWQRASYDAVITVAALLALITYASRIRRWRPRHRLTLAALIIGLCVFGYVLIGSLRWAGNRVGPVFQQLEERGPK